jgi:hypothetical protein
VEVGFIGGTVNGFMTLGEGSASDFQLLLRLRRKNRAIRKKMRTSPPITPPMIASVGFPSEELEEVTGGLDELPEGTLELEGVEMFEDVRVENGAFC